MIKIDTWKKEKIIGYKKEIYKSKQKQKQKAHMAKIVKDIEYSKERYGKKDRIVYQRECIKQE